IEARLEGTRLRTRAGWLDFAEGDLPAVRRLLDGLARPAGDVGVGLAGRLLRAGVLVPDPGTEPAAERRPRT
ncbi:hypothetical protein GTW43_20660, partial [Streptomyces sp. SID5785]|nr:hypothetical protein [Streptomyces sp. SID5785]